jgi:hypothetical protein
MPKRAATAVPEDLQIASKQIDVLEGAGKVLQDCQASLPLPSSEELAHLKKVRRTLTPETYRLGVYQRVMMAIENAADDLRAVIKVAAQEDLPELHLTHYDVKAIEAAVEALSASGSRTEEQP